MKLFLLLVLLGLGSLQAQEDLLASYQQVVQQFSAHSEIAFRMDYAWSSLQTPDESSHRLQMDIWKKGGQVYSRFADYEIYQDDHNYIYIDKQENTIHRMQIDRPASPSAFLDWEVFNQLVQFLALKGTKRLLKNGNQQIQFAPTNGTKTKLELEYYPKTRLIYRTLVAIDLTGYETLQHELNQSKLEAHFSNFQLKNVDLPVQLHQIIQGANGVYLGVGNYRKFKVK